MMIKTTKKKCKKKKKKNEFSMPSDGYKKIVKLWGKFSIKIYAYRILYRYVFGYVDALERI